MAEKHQWTVVHVASTSTVRSNKITNHRIILDYSTWIDIIIQSGKSDPCQGIHKKDLGQASLSIQMLLVSSLQLNGHYSVAGNSVYWLWILVLVTCDLAMSIGTEPTLRTADVDVVLGMLH